MSQIATILGVPVHSLTMSEAVEAVLNLIGNKKHNLIATANSEMIMMATKDKELKEILCSCNLVVPDGAGTVWAAHHLGYEMPERVAGYDLVQELLKIAPEKNLRFYFFGSAPTVAEKAKKKAEELYPGVEIVGIHDGYFSKDEEVKIIEEISALKPDILLCALGVPKQEKWLYEHIEKLKVPVSIGVGGTLDVMAGVMKRAPLIWQKAKLEWLYRGLLQPKRIGRLLALPAFVFKVIGSKKQ